MNNPESGNALFFDPENQEATDEATRLLDEVGIEYRMVQGHDFRGQEAPWFFFSEPFKILYGIENIRDFANLCYWSKTADELAKNLGEEQARHWAETPNELLGGRTPTEAYKQGDAKTVWGIVLVTQEGVYF